MLLKNTPSPFLPDSHQAGRVGGAPAGEGSALEVGSTGTLLRAPRACLTELSGSLSAARKAIDHALLHWCGRTIKQIPTRS